jgi:hypothetical protein
MIVEPVLGEGGYIVPPVAWHAGSTNEAVRCPRRASRLRRGSDRHRAHRSASSRPRRSAVDPRCLLFAKSDRLWAAARGDHRIAGRVSTVGRRARTARRSGGNPVCSCAAALATLDGDRGGGPLRAGSPSRRSRPGALAEVAEVGSSGVGLMIGVQLDSAETRGCGAASVPRRRPHHRAHMRPGRERVASFPGAQHPRKRTSIWASRSWSPALSVRRLPNGAKVAHELRPLSDVRHATVERPSPATSRSIGGELFVMRMGDAPGNAQETSADQADLVIHAATHPRRPMC